jgi:flagellar basal-body rod protein FlgB
MYEGVDRLGNIVNALSEHQKVISNNIANTHTPGYTRQTYSFQDVLGNLNNPFETQLSSKMGSMQNSTLAQETDGQPVDLAHEMVDMQKLFLNYTLVTRRMTTIFSNIRRASQIGR